MLQTRDSTSFLREQSCLVMDPSLRLSCEELLELPYFQEEGGASWGRESERPARRHDKGSRRRQPGVSEKRTRIISYPKPADCKSLSLLLSLCLSVCPSLGSVLASVTKQQYLTCTRCEETSEA